MGRIKGWVKWETKNPNFIRYDSLKSENFVYIGRRGNYWYVYSYDGSIKANFRSKNKAMKFAINWMRKHPYG